jgi:hypothetical protein
MSLSLPHIMAKLFLLTRVLISSLGINFIIHHVTLGIALVDETPALEGETDSSSQQQPLAEGLKFAYDAPDKTSTAEAEQVRQMVLWM